MIDLRIAPPSAFPWALENNLRRIGPLHKVRGHFMDAVRWHLDADSIWLYRRLRHNRKVDEKYFDGDESLCDETLLEPFALFERPSIPRNVLLAPLRVHGRLVGIVGVARKGREFEIGKGRVLTRLTSLLGAELARRLDERRNNVLDKIKEKVVAELRPKDLAYQILDGLHQLVHYDHSAALLTFEPESQVFRVEAEKIVWTKAKSAFVGHEISVMANLLEALTERNLRVLRGEPGDDTDRDDKLLYDLLDYHRGHSIPEPTSILCASLFFDGEFLGLLKIAGLERLAFDARDYEVVERFLPAAAVSLRNVRVKLSLENQAMQAEMRASLVTLARAVAHDVNNAIGSILPLADQIREDVKDGQIDPKSLEQDLDVIIEKASLCKRIFANMLKAGAERSGSGPVDVNRLIREMMPMMEAQGEPRGIELRADLAGDLPAIRFSKPHLERILWNLVTNAIEAMKKHGRIIVSTSVNDAGVSLTVTDDGPGIAAEILPKVQEPFFTTKSNGTGLGLSICRALAWQNGGGVSIKSEPGRGTEIAVKLPVAE